MSTEKKKPSKRKKAADGNGASDTTKSREVRATKRNGATGDENIGEWATRMAREHPMLLLGAGLLAGGVALRVVGAAARIPLLRGLLAGGVVTSLGGWSAKALEHAKTRFAR